MHGALALEEARRRLAEQVASLAQARQTAAAVLTAETIATTFLADVALRSHQGMPGWGWLAICALIVAVLADLSAVRPLKLETSTNAKDILEDPGWLELDSIEEAQAQLATFLTDAAALNAWKIDRKWRHVELSILATTISLTAWIVLLAQR